MATNDKDFWADAVIVSEYPWQQAVADGILHPIWQLHWKELTGDPLKPLLCTTNLLAEIRERMSSFPEHSTETLFAIYAMYLRWELDVKPTLAEEDQMFEHTWNGIRIWCIDDGTTITLLLPSDY
jgi:hypothetical protein